MSDGPRSADPIIEAGRNRPRAMPHLAVLLLGLLLPMAAQALDPRWTVLHEDSAGGSYIDLASVQHGEGSVDAWLLVDHVEVRRIPGVRRSESNSALAKVRIDCAGRRTGILSVELHANRFGEGGIVYQHSRQTPDMAKVESDPAMIRALELVCGAAPAGTGQR